MILLPLLALSGTAAFQPINKLPLGQGSPKFDFVVLGDNRPAGKGLPITSTFQEILGEVRMVHPAFVLSSGDLVYGNEEPLNLYNKELDDVQALVGTLGVPFYNAPGNHEIAGRAEFQKEYTMRFGPLFGSFDFGGWRFIALSTDQADNVASLSQDEQTFLGTALDSKPTCIYMHRPVFARKPDPSDAATVKQAPELHQLFKAHNVKAVFEGHDHVYNLQEHDGIRYIISGGAGAPHDASPQEGGFFHYIIVHVDGDKLTYDVIPSESLSVNHDETGWAIANYADADIDLRDLVLQLPVKPSAVKASVDKKGKSVAVPAEITSAVKSGDSWNVHVHVLATKHRKTVVEFPG